jgi:hypothetical protein
MEGCITCSRQYVTAAHPPPENAAVNTIEGHATDFITASKGPLAHSHHVKKPSSRFLDVEVETKVSLHVHNNLICLVAA